MSIVVARLNDRAQPLDRGEMYEDPLDAALQRAGLGTVTGGGTLVAANGEVELCDVEIELPDASGQALEALVALLERLGAPKGSHLIVGTDEPEVPFGTQAGLAVHLNGTDLPDDVYRDCEVNHVYEELDRLLAGRGRIHSHWQGPTETALYLYGESFESMHEAIADFLQSYPLCERARLVQIT